MCCGRSRVQTRGTPIFLQRNINQTKEGHVAPKHWATCPLLIRSQYNTCQHPIGQQSTNRYEPCHQAAMSAIWYVPPRGHTDCTDRYSQHPNFDLFDLTVKSRYLLHTDSICENKYTAGIRKTRRTQWHYFHHIPSTLKIEQNLIP